MIRRVDDIDDRASVGEIAPPVRSVKQAISINKRRGEPLEPGRLAVCSIVLYYIQEVQK